MQGASGNSARFFRSFFPLYLKGSAMVRCKLKCESAKDGRVIMRAVSGDSEENKTFFKYTPNGLLDFSTVNESAAAQFVEGHEYYVDISPAPAQS